MMVAGEEQYRVEGRGNGYVSADSYEIKLDNILYLPNVHKNLISVGKIVDKDHVILFAE